MAIYGQDAYGFSVYGSDTIANIFYDWLPRIHKRLDTNTELQRFLQIFSYEFWQMKYSIDGQLDLFNVNTCPLEFLPYLGYLVGVDFNYDLPEQYARQEIASAIPFYKVKGTVAGIQYYVQSITGWRCQVEFVTTNFYMFTNTVGCYTPNVNDATATNMPLPSVYSAFIGTPDDILKYTAPDSFFGPLGLTNFWLILTVPDDDVAQAAKTAKLTRVAPDFSPINTKLIGIITELFSSEVFNLALLSDSYETDFISILDTEDYTQLAYVLVTNEGNKWTNNSESLTAYTQIANINGIYFDVASDGSIPHTIYPI